MVDILVTNFSKATPQEVKSYYESQSTDSHEVEVEFAQDFTVVDNQIILAVANHQPNYSVINLYAVDKDLFENAEWAWVEIDLHTIPADDDYGKGIMKINARASGLSEKGLLRVFGVDQLF